MIVTRVIIADKMTSAIAITAAIAQVVNTEPDGPGATTEIDE